ncbi:uncharacterized protein PODANS_5_9760, partial [Podospora anserina S mat+]
KPQVKSCCDIYIKDALSSLSLPLFFIIILTIRSPSIPTIVLYPPQKNPFDPPPPPPNPPKCSSQPAHSPPSRVAFLSLASAAPTTPAPASPLEVEAREIAARARGQFTWYNTGLGACGKWNNDGELVVALNRHVFDPQTPNGNPNIYPLCGREILAKRI